MFVALERASHAADAARMQTIAGAIGVTTLLSWIITSTSTKDNGARARAYDKVRSELRVHHK